jgi:hypothetical protein
MEGGLIVESGPPSEVLVRPREERTRNFLARALAAHLGDVAIEEDGEETESGPG